METDVGVEIPKPRFPHRLAKRLLAFRTVPTGPAAITNPQGWAKSDDQSGPNQVDKTIPELAYKISPWESARGNVGLRTSSRTDAEQYLTNARQLLSRRLTVQVP